MSFRLKRSAFLAVGLAIALLPGCGGGGGSSSGTTAGITTVVQGSDRSGGGITMRLTFPQLPGKSAATRAVDSSGFPTGYFGDIPIGTGSVTITLTNPSTGAQIVAPKLVTAPVSNGSVVPFVEVEFTFLPAGPVHVAVAAYASTNGTGNPLATGSKDGEIFALATSTINLILQLNGVSIAAQPPVLNLSLKSGNQTLNGVVSDASGHPVPYTLTFQSNNTAVATVASSAGAAASIHPVAIGTTTVTITEPNSGNQATATVNVSQ